MSIDDPVKVRLQQLQEATRPTLPANLAHAAFLASLALVQQGLGGMESFAPVAAAAIHSLFTWKGREFIDRRFVKLLEEMTARLKAIEESVPDQDYFASEEFATLLTLGIQQLQTTHDATKLKMLADALANSGSKEFFADTAKEQFIRTFRDLSLNDILVLKRFPPLLGPGGPIPGGQLPYRPKLAYFDHKDESSVGRLRGMGLINDNIEPHKPHFIGAGTATEKQRQFESFVLRPEAPNVSYEITTFGERFLLFVSDAVPRRRSKTNLRCETHGRL